MTHRLSRLFCLIAVIFFIAIKSSRVQCQDYERKLIGYEVTFPCMGTLVSLLSFSDDPILVENAFQEARKEMDRLVKIFSDYDEESETRQATIDAKIGNWQAVSPELWEVMCACDDWNRLSDGAFDASVGRLTILWRKARKTKLIPTEIEIEDACNYCGWKHIELDKDANKVRINRAGLRLDFGAIAKGYIIEKTFELLASRGLSRSLVRAGGDIRCGQAPPGKDGWKIEIASMEDSDKHPPQFVLTNAAISSSGDLHQYMFINGKRRSHVIDPRTGVGVEGPMMVTVIASNAMDADGADTAICVMGHDAGMALVKSRPDLHLRIISRLGVDPKQNTRISISPGFPLLLP